MKFVKTLKACQVAENAQWSIGDALIEECGPPGETHARNGGSDKLVEAAKLVSENGLDYSEGTLRVYRSIAHAFPDVTRVTSVSFGCHQEAGNPERLQVVLDWLKANDPKAKPTRRLIREVLDTLVARERAARMAKGQVLSDQIERDTERRGEIITTLQTINDEDSKIAAREELAKVETSIKAAREERVKVQGAAALRRSNVTIEPTKLPMILFLEISSTIGTALVSLERAQKMVEENRSKLTGEDAGAIIEECLQVIDVAKKIVDSTRGLSQPKSPKQRRAGLSVVGE